MKPSLNNYIPAPDRVILDEPIIETKYGKGEVEKTEAAIKAEKAKWVEDGKPLKVAKDYKSSDGRFEVKTGDYVILSTQFGIVHIEFEDGGRWQIPTTSIAGKFTI